MSLAPRHQNRSEAERETILVINDEPDSLELLRIMGKTQQTEKMSHRNFAK